MKFACNNNSIVSISLLVIVAIAFYFLRSLLNNCRGTSDVSLLFRFIFGGEHKKHQEVGAEFSARGLWGEVFKGKLC